MRRFTALIALLFVSTVFAQSNVVKPSSDSATYYLNQVEVAKLALAQAQSEGTEVAIWKAKAEVYQVSSVYFTCIGDKMQAYRAKRMHEISIAKVYELSPTQEQFKIESRKLKLDLQG